MDQSVIDAARSAAWALQDSAMKFEQLAAFYKGRSARELYQKAEQARSAADKLVGAVPEAKI